ncbi:MAG: S-adenosylmethionine:tRNA ribosyltransferase-isomerase [Paracoccaceae bacterium]
MARVEVTLLEPRAGGLWSALAKPLRKLREGECIVFSGTLSARVESIAGAGAFGFRPCWGRFRCRVGGSRADAAAALYRGAACPDADDKQDYQTVFARHAGAVAAPTASLHFDDELLAALRARGVAFSEVTLHVGAGTFLPVKVEDVTTHRMHAEWGEVTTTAAAEINATHAAGGRVIPVGTTALRLIESAADEAGQVMAWRGETDIFIYPGYRFRVTDALMTNFHLPRSTLLMLVSALMGTETMLRVYEHAVAHGYRFFSYGDASLLIPGGRA